MTLTTSALQFRMQIAARARGAQADAKEERRVAERKGGGQVPAAFPDSPVRSTQQLHVGCYGATAGPGPRPRGCAPRVRATFLRNRSAPVWSVSAAPRRDGGCAPGAGRQQAGGWALHWVGVL